MTHAVTLSGGGAYGAFEVGVLKALMHGDAPITEGVPLNPKIFTGSSAGAYLSAVLLSADAVDPAGRAGHLERVWLEQVTDSPSRGGNGVYYLRGDPRRYLDPGWIMRRTTEDLSQFASSVMTRMAAVATSHEPLDRRAFELFDLTVLISTDPFRDLVERTVSIEAIRHSDRLIRIAATNWKTGELVSFDNEQITHEAVLASASIPGIFPVVRINGEPYVDGSVLMNTPFKPAIDLGADVIHVVALDPDLAKTPPPAMPNTMDTIGRMLNITNSSRIGTDLKLVKAINAGLASDPEHRAVHVHIYRPQVDMGGVSGMMDFSRDRMLRLIEQGFQSAVTHNCSRSNCV